MEPNNQDLSFDESSLAFSILKRLGAGAVDTFEERLKSQKVQYLAQVFNVSPAYSFSLYLRGPYSSKLADDLFRFSREEKKPDLTPFVSDELEDRFSRLRTFITHKTTRELELVATMHWLLKVVNFRSLDAIKKLEEWKSASRKEVTFVMAELQKI